ncbi:MAG: NmrA family NAD(P)-binding protein [Cyanobacteria bacterium P01_F01_bin.153]
MKVLVVGGTGTLGRQVVRRALDEGLEVRCLVRSYSRAAFLREWGAELVGADICRPDTIPAAFAEPVDAIIDAATARATDSLGVREVDWQGKVNLIQAAKTAGVERYIFFSILDCEKHSHVTLMDIKRCTELYLAEMEMDYTILRPCGFLQGLVGQFAIPVLDNQNVWVAERNSPIAYMDTQDIAKFAVKSLTSPDSIGKTLPVVGPRAWSADEIINLCERLSKRDARVTRTPIAVMKFVQQTARWFKWTNNIADRLAFAEIFASGTPLSADMEETYKVLGIDPEEITTIEAYLDEYFSRIMKKLREIDYEKTIKAKQDKRKKSLRF